MKITKLIGREIFDSRGLPTVECDLTLEGGISVTASVPSGTSKGSHEAVELRDGGSRLGGMGVTKAVDIIDTKIAKALVGQELNAQQLDQVMIELDGTPNKAKLGANSMLAVSMAMYRAQAIQEGAELFELIAWIMGHDMVTMPVPFFNVINGGAHADDNLRIQEFMIVPLGSKSFKESVDETMDFYQCLKKLLKKKGKSTNVGLEGGFAPGFEDEIDVFNCLTEALLLYDKPENNIFAFAIDVAATQFYNKKTKMYDWHGDQVSSDDLIEYYVALTKNFPIFSIEDGLAEDDWDGWVKLTQELGDNVQIVGDDLFVTSAKRIEQGVMLGAANSVIIKPNQIGTITQTLQTIQLCKDQSLNTIVSHRSGETTDTFIADLAVGSAAGQIKAGGCSRGERVCKYNRLLKIEDILIRSIMEKNNL